MDKRVLVLIFILALSGLMVQPASAFDVAMGSYAGGTVVTSHTRSSADLFGNIDTEVPTISHTINIVALGSVGAGMVAHTPGDPFETYQYHITATGRVVQFNTSMKYQPQVPRAHLFSTFQVP